MRPERAMDERRRTIGSRRRRSVLMVVAVACAIGSSPLMAAASPAGCSGATIVGTNRGDYLYGTRGRDVIAGLGGDDYIDGRGGDDVICGGPGRDQLLGGDGNDVVDGGPGTDVMVFGRSRIGVTADLSTGVATGMGRDRFSGIEGLGGTSRGNDVLIGDDRANLFQGFGGDDVIRADDGDDRIFSDPGDDTFDGGEGRDTVDFSTSYAGPVIVNLLAKSAAGDGEDAFVGIEDVSGTVYGDLLIGDDAPTSWRAGPGAT
jgi:Ca2+-binding RTX toxin-like protein